MTDSFALPRPADWSGAWRVVYRPTNLTTVYVDASTHSGNGDESCPVTDYRAARFVSYRGQDMTLDAHFTRGADGEWIGGEYNRPARRRNSVKYDDPAPKTYNAAFLAALVTALEGEWQAHPDRWQAADRAATSDERERLERKRDEALTAYQDAQDALDRHNTIHGEL